MSTTSQPDNKDKSKQFDLEMAELIWLKVKGIKIPEEYSEEDRLSILERYWHRAMNKEDLPEE